jgi:hypothetical protein
MIRPMIIGLLTLQEQLNLNINFLLQSLKVVVIGEPILSKFTYLTSACHFTQQQSSVINPMKKKLGYGSCYKSHPNGIFLEQGGQLILHSSSRKTNLHADHISQTQNPPPYKHKYNNHSILPLISHKWGKNIPQHILTSLHLESLACYSTTLPTTLNIIKTIQHQHKLPNQQPQFTRPKNHNPPSTHSSHTHIYSFPNSSITPSPIKSSLHGPFPVHLSFSPPNHQTPQPKFSKPKTQKTHKINSSANPTYPLHFCT